MKLSSASISKPGGRKKNEDACAIIQTEEYGCYAIADGLGGHGGGDIASRLVLDTIMNSFYSHPGIGVADMESYLQYAQMELLKKQKEKVEFGSMRTTVVLLVTDYQNVVWAHIGDSRLYYFHGGKILFQTKDHSVPQAMVNAGELNEAEMRFHDDRNRLTRAMGIESAFKPVIIEEARNIESGDAFLLCTDGFWEYVFEEEMEQDLSVADTPGDWLDRMEKRMLQRVNVDHDNYSAVVLWL